MFQRQHAAVKLRQKPLQANPYPAKPAMTCAAATSPKAAPKPASMPHLQAHPERRMVTKLSMSKQKNHDPRERTLAGWCSTVRLHTWLTHSIRTAVAASVSLAFARFFRMPEPYWAAITTLIVMQSTLGASWDISKLRIIGTALGAAAGGLLASCFVVTVPLFAIALIVLGISCAALRLDPSAYRFAGVTLAIVTLLSRPDALPFVLALQRFAEVCIGIVVALGLSAVWPEREGLIKAPNPH
jgi:uncharacterized membrane protein YccC